MIFRFTRPEIRNPLSVEVVLTLTGLIRHVGRNVRAVIITGSDGVFASGADLREIANITGQTAKNFALLGQQLMNVVADAVPKTIAAVDGYCYGGALDLALACNSRIASPDVEFCHPGSALGIMTGWGGTQRLPRLIGEAAAIEMFLTGKKLRAEEALEIGLIDEIAADPVAAAIRAYL